MNSKKPIWKWKAKSCRITKSLSLTVEDARKELEHNGKKVLQPAARAVIKKLLRKKRRQLPIEKLRDLE